MNCITRFLTRIHTQACFRLHVAAFPPIGPEVDESCVNLRDGDRCGLLISEARGGYWEGPALWLVNLILNIFFILSQLG